LQGLDGKQVSTWLVLGEVVAVHIDKRFIRDGVYQTAAAQPILRGGGPADYFEIAPEQLFHMWRPAR
jgi:flavin reductase (DIM6/NTAB) family NADH-FMN oxidoreductase RutF